MPHRHRTSPRAEEPGDHAQICRAVCRPVRRRPPARRLPPAAAHRCRCWARVCSFGCRARSPSACRLLTRAMCRPLGPHPLCLRCSTGTFFCVDLSVTAVVIKGLAEHKDELGAPLCPCRHYDDKAAEAEQGFWNCPCVPMRERKVSPAQWVSGRAWRAYVRMCRGMPRVETGRCRRTVCRPPDCSPHNIPPPPLHAVPPPCGRSATACCS